MRIGVDIGGTFTDMVAFDDQSGQLEHFKCLTTAEDLCECFFNAVSIAVKRAPVRSVAIVHGTTIATNALLEGRTPPAAMITTRGFRDVLEIGRHFRRRLYDLFLDKPRVLISRDKRVEVVERMDTAGAPIEGLQPTEIRNAAVAFQRKGIRSVAICFINSYANGKHEQQAAQILKEEAPCLSVSISSEVCPEYREFERFSTAVVNACVLPVVDGYLRALNERCKASSLSAQISVMQSNGGIMSVDEARCFPVRMIESGPAAGVLAAQYLGKLCGEVNLLTFDMGGTTAKVGLIHDGKPEMKAEYRVGGGIHGDDSDGYPIRIPAIDLVEVSAGGGSIASAVSRGTVRVGPESAGAHPGPTCYRLGGTQPTVTDANLAAGRIIPEYFLGGQMVLDLAAARQSIAKHIAEPLGLALEQAAVGILEIANSQMARAMKLITIERGYRPSTFAMMAFGGAGPLHATALAEEMGIRKVIIPRMAGVASALGLIAAPYRHDLARSFRSLVGQVNLDALETLYSELEQLARQAVAQSSFDSCEISFHRFLEMRYVGQAYEVTVHIPGEALRPSHLARATRDFHRLHKQLFAHCHPDKEVEIILARLAAIGRTPSIQPDCADSGPARSTRISRSHQAFFRGRGWLQTAIYMWNDWPRGHKIHGPAIVLRDDSTMLVAPDWYASLDPFGNGVLER